MADRKAGVPVVLHEMRPVRGTDAHKTDSLAELVCSNSFRSDDADSNAVGLLHAEMRLAGSLIMACGRRTSGAGRRRARRRPRRLFGRRSPSELEAHPLITIEREEVAGLPPAEWDQAIIATGPLTAPALAAVHPGAKPAPMRSPSSTPSRRSSISTAIDMDICWFQSRYDKVGPGGTGKDYINCPMDKEQYDAFIEALIAGDKTEFKEWEGTPYFDGCLPIEVMAERGVETLRHGPMKPMGLTNAAQPDRQGLCRRAAAAGQCARHALQHGRLPDQAETWRRRRDIFRMIPGLENAEFARLGGLHRNTYINSPTLLDASLQLKSRPGLRFAGQITGCEGYVESAAIGLLAGRFAAAERLGEAAVAAAGHHRVRRAAQPHHRRPYRHRRRAGQALLPADERQFRPVSRAGARSIVKPEGVKRFRGKDKTIMKRQLIAKRALADCAAWLGQAVDTRRKRLRRLVAVSPPSYSARLFLILLGSIVAKQPERDFCGFLGDANS